MPAQITWLIEGKVLHIRSWGRLTIEDFQMNKDIIMEMLNTATSPIVHTLLDETDVEAMPRNMVALRESTTWTNHPRFGWAISYGNDERFLNFVTSFISQVARIRYRRFATAAEAIAFLQSREKDLPDLAEALERHQARFPDASV